MSRCCSQCGTNGHNSRTCSSPADEDSSSTAGEIMLFGVRVKIDPMRKSVSMNNLSQYELPLDQPSIADASAAAAAVVAADTGYASADDVVRSQSTGSRERKRGTPWTEEEHKLFLIGLQKVGKGDWRGISRNFVKTRTPTQVASHAQKYFLRRSNLNRRRRRSSLFDITTDTVAATPMEEEHSHQDNNISRLPPHLLPSHDIPPHCGLPMAPFPGTVGPVLIPVQVENPMENLTLGHGNQVNDGSMMPVRPIAVLPMANTTSSDLNLSQKRSIDSTPNLSLRLSLSLSSDHNQSRHSAFQVMSSFNNGDNVISVA